MLTTMMMQTMIIGGDIFDRVPNLEELELYFEFVRNAKIETIGDLVQKTEQEMLKTKNFGRKSLNEIKVILTEMNLALGTSLDNFDSANNPHEK